MYAGLIFAPTRELAYESRLRLRLRQDMFPLSYRQVRLGGGRVLALGPLVILIHSPAHDPVKDLWAMAFPQLVGCFTQNTEPLKIGTLQWTDL